ncbi:MAG: hypothetical protein P8076_02815 [Gammaproteobacteria bacterium]
MNTDRQPTRGPILTEEQLERYIREAHRLRSETIGGGIVRLGLWLGSGFKRLASRATGHRRAPAGATDRPAASGGPQRAAGMAPEGGPARAPRAVTGRTGHPTPRAA